MWWWTTPASVPRQSALQTPPPRSQPAQVPSARTYMYVCTHARSAEPAAHGRQARRPWLYLAAGHRAVQRRDPARCRTTRSTALSDRPPPAAAAAMGSQPTAARLARSVRKPQLARQLLAATDRRCTSTELRCNEILSVCTKYGAVEPASPGGNSADSHEQKPGVWPSSDRSVCQTPVERPIICWAPLRGSLSPAHPPPQKDAHGQFQDPSAASPPLQPANHRRPPAPVRSPLRSRRPR